MEVLIQVIPIYLFSMKIIKMFLLSLLFVLSFLEDISMTSIQYKITTGCLSLT